MSLIREVIEIVSSNEVIDTRKNISKLLDEIKNFQYKVKSFITDNYVDFLPNLANNQLFLEEGIRLSNECDNVMQNINNETKLRLLSVSDDLRLYIDELEEISLGIKTANKILKVDEHFKFIEESNRNYEYLDVLRSVSEIKCLIDDQTDELFKKMDCFDNIKVRWLIENEMLLHNLKQRFDSLVQLNEKLFQTTKVVTMRISKDERLLQQTIVALITSKYNPRQICDFLMKNVFQPIITKPVSLEFDEKNVEFAVITLSFSLQPLVEDLRPNYKIVFRHICAVIRCLEYMNISITDNSCIFGIISNIIKEPFLSILSNDCLTFAIPNTMDEMNDSTIVQDVLEFNAFLSETKFLNEDVDVELKEFAEKVEVIFKNRFCINILHSAVDIMQKDLHDMILVTDNESKISGSNPATFPRCMVSKSTLELVTLMEKVIRQTNSSSGDIIERLISTIPTIVESYLTEVPSYHAKLLQNIPQQTALFHNNCMYLAYWLTKNNNLQMELFANKIISLQHCGTDHFSRQINNQHEQLMDILRDFDPSTCDTDNTSHKVVRQCLRQMDLLKNVWQTILSDIVYNKTMGNILNDFCSEFIRRILIIEDIASAVSNCLVDLCDCIIERAPSVFVDPLQISVVVRSWVKLTQLKMILNASMVHITEQWSEGKGPLTLHYKADEIKHLIRALFQNTDRRSQALSKII